ncbi:MAG: hypothetical protein L3J06_02005 [Cyclobacteriaceae bacterium]|nr:hypothetical protein [Cyclobacteriaceae bacterium]
MAMIITVTQSKVATTVFHVKEKIIISEYVGRVNIELALMHLKEVSRFYSANEVRGSIVDLSKVFGSFAKVLDYLGKEAFPTAKKSGLCCLCYVVKDDLIMENLTNRLKFAVSSHNIEAKVLKSRAEAEYWIKAQLNTRYKSN